MVKTYRFYTYVFASKIARLSHCRYNLNRQQVHFRMSVIVWRKGFPRPMGSAHYYLKWLFIFIFFFSFMIIMCRLSIFVVQNIENPVSCILFDNNNTFQHICCVVRVQRPISKIIAPPHGNSYIIYVLIRIKKKTINFYSFEIGNGISRNSCKTLYGIPV